MRDEPWLERPVSDLLAKCGRSLAVDIGANRGTWSAFFKPLFSRVIAVEPDERCPQIPGTDFYRCLIGATSGQGTLWLSSYPEQNHTGDLHPLHHSGGRPVELPQITLNELCGGMAPDFIKIDVEGAEDRVLAGITVPERYNRTAFLIESHAREKELTQILSAWRRPFAVIPHPDPCPDHCWFSVPPLT